MTAMTWAVIFTLWAIYAAGQTIYSSWRASRAVLPSIMQNGTPEQRQACLDECHEHMEEVDSYLPQMLCSALIALTLLVFFL